MNEELARLASHQPLELPLHDILNSLPDGVYVTDTQRKILFWNKAAERITGWREQDVVGKSCSDKILAHTDKDGHALCGYEHCPLHRSMVTCQPSTEAIVIYARCKWGTAAPVEVSVAPICDHVGRVIGGIEVFRDVTQSVQELLRAKAIQDQAISCSLPQDGRLEFSVRYQPCDLVGGDFYRIDRRDENHYSLLIADAMGHGVAAALNTMQLRSLWEEHRSALESPARFLDVLNQCVHGLVPDAGFFATAVCATYDAAQGLFRCARAGHPAPLLFRSDGAAETVGTAQPALGMLLSNPYVESAAQLEAGDALLLFTDGAVEVFDSQQRQLGLDGLKRLVRSQNADRLASGFQLDELEQQLLRFSDDIHLPDDLTLLKLLRVK